ncbi:MAG: preprotein translocase subunit YajC [Phycisphaerae bacterium]|nr:preprotein translocase subunit YajC [Phycisphaerae bacterium]
MSEFLTLIAQETAVGAANEAGAGTTATDGTTAVQQTPGGAAPSGQKPQGGGAFYEMILPIVLMMGVFYWIMYRGNRKERRKHDDMLNALKRNDRVQTIGGILGTVVEARENEVILKVDETSNVKLHFARGAIKDVLSQSATDGKS